MIASVKDNDELQLNAYCDGELDPASAIEFERRLADDEALKARYIRLLSLRRAVRSLPQLEVPPGLRARINWMRIVSAKPDVQARRRVRVREAGRFRRWLRQRCLAR
jgi:anti-sigma factor RsiW